MRALFLLLVLANLVFLAYTQFAREDADAGARIAQLELAPDKVKQIQSAVQAPPERPKAQGRAIPPAVPKPAPAACLEWGLFAGPAVAKAEGALAQLELPAGRIERTVADSGGYWVYLPPQKAKADVDRKIGELKEFGVTEFFVVQEAGQWRNAISLGIFRTDEAAQAFLGKLRERGVRTAVAGRRENFLKQVAFHVREPDPALVAKLTEMQKAFPGTEMKAGPCPGAAVAAKN